ncbi:MAG: antiporter inner membrane protein [Tenericutes bacterium ADurb.Bin239]|jgi:Mrp family chromosome partitioning ATPase|nr:MAG: antiporter inner membrane protein [Tenericutes bacterium ADurb.Bin239]
MNKNDKSNINHIIGIVSGKGGVGKSYVTGSLAVELAKQGYRVGILDGDVTGPSIPHMFNIDSGVYGDEEIIYPAASKVFHIKIISSALLLAHDEDPIMWRGPLIGSLVTQFYTTVNWGELDYLLIDFPPGTSDVAISAFANIPVDGIILVTTPQQMVQQIVKKTYKMAKEMKVKLIGVIENMAYIVLPESKEKYYLYGQNKLENLQKTFPIKVLGSLPLLPANTKLVDEGKIEVTDTSAFTNVVESLIKELEYE